MSKQKYYINICNPPVYLEKYLENHELITEKTQYWEDKNNSNMIYNSKPTGSNYNRMIQIYACSEIHRDFLKFLIECLEAEHLHLENCFKLVILKKRGRPNKKKEV